MKTKSPQCGCLLLSQCLRDIGLSQATGWRCHRPRYAEKANIGPKVDRHQDRHRSIEALSRTGAMLIHSNPIGSTAFVGQTRVPTRNGVSTLKVTAEAGADIQVITSQGWDIATPVTHGPARLYPVIQERIGVERQVYATTDHIWFVYPASSCKRNESRRPATQRNVLCVCKSR